MAITIKTCEHCGEQFAGTSRARFCKDTCRAAAHYAAKKPAPQKAPVTTPDDELAGLVGQTLLNSRTKRKSVLVAVDEQSAWFKGEVRPVPLSVIRDNYEVVPQ